jgi:16S rRNA (cytidine1402-2'-O)-methyltransferase
MITGTLYIVSTPIGNLADMTYRAVEILKTVDLIAAEDTRHSAYLLQHYDIRTKCISLHSHNEQERTTKLIQELESGKNIALISDAGTPLISDPGFHFVERVAAAEIKVVPIPGACALIAALSASGLSTESFIFEGFLSPKSKARKDQLLSLLNETRTIIFYEAPHRILESLESFVDVFGDRQAVIAREVTKQFETIYRGPLPVILEKLVKNPVEQKGEFVVLIRGAVKNESVELLEAKRIALILSKDLPVKQASSLAAEITGRKKNELYDYLLTQLSLRGA